MLVGTNEMLASTGYRIIIVMDFCDLLAANLLGSLPPNQRQVLERVPIIVLPTKDPNAMVIAIPGCGTVIAIDYGLMSLLATLNKLVLCRLNVFGLEPTMELNQASRIAKNAVEHFLEKIRL